MKAILASFERHFWFANLMELIERWAYYGVRMLLSVYVVSLASQGGLEFNHIQKGQIFAGWAIIQSTFPILIGGYADRLGYKKTISGAIVIKIIGYLLMATQKSYLGFFIGCMLLATGTAFFKPAVQGMLVSSLNKNNSSLGWGIFYWLINLGGLLGPWLAGYLRLLSWQYVFFGNALIVSLNFIVLLFCPASIGQHNNQQTSTSDLKAVFIQTIKEMLKPSLISFLLIYSGFWMMYNQLFDTLPNFIVDWIDTSPLVASAGRLFNYSSWIRAANQSLQIPPEWIININCATIILAMIPLSWVMRQINIFYSMIVGVCLTLIGMFTFGSNHLIWLTIAGIVIFSVGEMGASPRMREYLGLISPSGKAGQYMGYANVPEAIGWGFGSYIAGWWYEVFSDKTSLAKKYFVEHLGYSGTQLQAIPKGDLLTTLANQLGISTNAITALLWNEYHPEKIWFWFIGIGLLTAIGLVFHYKMVSKHSSNLQQYLAKPNKEPELLESSIKICE